MLSYISKTIMAMLFAAVAVFENTMAFAAVTMLFVLADCWSAYDLNRRLSRKYPGKVTGKFQSNHALKMFKTFRDAYIVIVLLYIVDYFILKDLITLYLSNIAAAMFCGLEFWSILENKSSANDAMWAKVAQRIMADKTKRHFNIDLYEFSKNNDADNATSNDSMQQEDFPGYPNPRI